MVFSCCHAQKIARVVDCSRISVYEKLNNFWDTNIFPQFFQKNLAAILCKVSENLRKNIFIIPVKNKYIIKWNLATSECTIDIIPYYTTALAALSLIFTIKYYLIEFTYPTWRIKVCFKFKRFWKIIDFPSNWIRQCCVPTIEIGFSFSFWRKFVYPNHWQDTCLF